MVPFPNLGSNRVDRRSPGLRPQLVQTIDTRHQIAAPGIKILTVESSRGLQFRTVILIFADKFDEQGPGQDRALAYVALTRPEDHMAVTFSRVTEPIPRIVAGTVAVVLPGES